MKCDSCGNTTRINWGNAYTTLCEACSDSDTGKQLVEKKRFETSSEPQHRGVEPHDTANSIFSFEGRIKRGTFWVVIISLFLISFVLQMAAVVSAESGSSDGIVVLLLIYFIPAIWVAFATYVKRWHDLNLSGWMLLTLFIPFVNFLIFLYLGLAPGTTATNKYGDAPQ